MEIAVETNNLTNNNSSKAEDDSDNNLMSALDDFLSSGKGQLSFKKHDTLRILQKTNDIWWWAELNGCYGYVPASYFVDSDGQSSWQNEEYFGNYGNLKLHHEMLSDRPRNLAYMNAIICNSEYLRGKVILDVGCGTGILSMMCAKYADPKKIYAVEASDMAIHTKEVIETNRMSDKIEVIHGYAEEVELEDKVDVIISEWMGTVLLFEMMLESVINMRDRFLKEDGKIWPSSASLFLVPCSAHAQYTNKVDFWDSQFGFDFSSLKAIAKEDLVSKPFHDYVLPKEDCLCQDMRLFQLDMYTVRVENLEQITSEFDFSIRKDEIMHGFCMWFEVAFDPSNPNGDQIFLNTGPFHELTHWKQNLFLLDEPMKVKVGDSVSGILILTRNPNFRRHLRAEFEFTLSSGSKVSSVCKKMFYIWR